MAIDAGAVTATAATPLDAVSITDAARVSVTTNVRPATETWSTVPAERVVVTIGQAAHYDDWALDRVPPSLSEGTLVVTDFEYQHHRLELTYRVSTDSVDQVRQYAKNAGKYNRPVATDGFWRTRDRSLSGNTVVVTPPDALVGPFTEQTYHVADYDERRQSSRWTEVTLTLIRETPRKVSGSEYSETPAADEWTFQFSRGTLGVTDVEIADLRPADVYQLTFPVEHAQAKTLLESPTKLDAVSVHRVPDGDDFARDNIDSGRNTVTISRPADGSVDASDFTDGAYVVTDWTLRFDVPFRYEVELRIYPT